MRLLNWNKLWNIGIQVCISCTREVITTALYCKYWSYSPGEQKNINKLPYILRFLTGLWNTPLFGVIDYLKCIFTYCTYLLPICTHYNVIEPTARMSCIHSSTGTAQSNGGRLLDHDYATKNWSKKYHFRLDSQIISRQPILVFVEAFLNTLEE